MRPNYVFVATAIVVGLTAACHSKTPPAVPPAQPHTAAPAPLGATPPAPPPAVTRSTAPSTPPPSAEELFNRETLAQLNSEHPLGDAFFDYDSAALRDDARSALQTDAAWLRKWQQTSIRIVGHCDERGTAEYNLALGDRRAKAAEAYLVSLGINAKRINVSSVGKEEPFCSTADTDSCWSQNRRGHFLITAK